MDTTDQSVSDEQEQAVAQEYKPGELAPVIVTSATKWKPDDFEDKSLIGVITSLINTCSTTDEAARRFSVLQTWENRHMDRGYQYLEAAKDGKWGIIGQDQKNPTAHADDANLYPTNIFSAQGDIATGSLCRGEIKVNFAPKRNKDPREVACADEANKYKYIWSKANNKMNLQRQVMETGWTDCRVVMWTRNVADKSRFGTMDDGETPKTVQVSTVHGVLETKLPMMVDCLADCGYAQVFEEMDYAIARAAYPWMGNKIKPSWGTFGELEFERIARINTRIGIVGKYITGTSGIREVTMGYCWFRPGMYYDDRVTSAQREFLLSKFPDGLFVVMAGAEFCCCWNESMDDHLAHGNYTRGFGQNRRTLGSSDVPIQKRINIWADLWDKFVRKAIPATLLDNDAYNAEAISQLEADPGRFIQVAPRENQAIQDTVGQTPAPVPIPGMAEMLQWYLGPLIQSIDGATPALFGKGEGEDNTVGATQIRLQQSLERFGPTWIMANWLFATAVTQAVKCCAEIGGEEIYDTIPGVGDVSVNPMNLKGNPDCYPETINGIPESGAQKEAKVLSILDMAQQNPQVASLVATPSNAREIVKALHIDDVITIDEANSEDKQLEEIETLLETQPLINPAWQQLSDQVEMLNLQHEQAKQVATEALASGSIPPPEMIQQGQQMETKLQQLQQQLAQTPQYLPSVPVAQDDSEDHVTEAATLFAWMQEPDGRSLRSAASHEQPGGPNWNKWMNCYLHWQAHKQMIAATAKAAAPPPKVSITGKLTPEQQAQILMQQAGIQTSQQSLSGANEQETEARIYTPVSEIVQKTKRRL